MVLNKPPGLPVQGGERVKVSLDSILSEKIKPRPLLVHRLDKDTSGIILVAKSKEAARFFSSLFAGGGTMVKRYLGLCSGIISPEKGLIKLDLGVRQKGRNRTLKKSETFYKLLSAGGFMDFSFSFLELELGTGRMHQIRRHLSRIGHPLFGDEKYGDFSLNKKLKAYLKLKHLLLHSCALIIPPSPLLPGGLDVKAPIPDFYVRFLNELNIS
jgi:23S rRNA pseudouridine955/2504/2580 synthase